MRPIPLQKLMLRLMIGAVTLLAIDTVLLVVAVVLLQGHTSTSSSVCDECPAIAAAPTDQAVATQPLGTPPGADDPSAQQPTSPPPLPLLSGSDDALALYLDATVIPLRQAAEDFGVDPVVFVPTEAEIRAATESGSIDSEPFLAVMQKLRVGYEQFNMALPAPEHSIPSSVVTGPSGSEPQAGSGRTATGLGPGEMVLLALFRSTIAGLQEHHRDAGAVGLLELPTETECLEAASTGDLSSIPSKQVIQRLRAAHLQLGVPFPDDQFSE